MLPEALLQQADDIAYKTEPVLICGEHGSGKKSLARYIHGRSNPAFSNFINIPAGQGEQLETLLQEIGRSRYSGDEPAHNPELAFGGTLLLDQIENLPRKFQQPLLSLIEADQAAIPGFGQPQRWRIIATCVSPDQLAERVERGSFLSSLYFQLKAGLLEIAPLRERSSELSRYVQQWTPLLLDENRVDQASREQFMDTLQDHCWPGNVLELESILKPLQFRRDLSTDVIRQESLRLEAVGCVRDCAHYDSCARDGSDCDDNSEQPLSNEDLSGSLRHHEFELISKTLHEVNGSRKVACEKLGIKSRTLRYKLAKMRELGYDVPGVNA